LHHLTEDCHEDEHALLDVYENHRGHDDDVLFHEHVYPHHAHDHAHDYILFLVRQHEYVHAGAGLS
jgi:hypothetical protein